MTYVCCPKCCALYPEDGDAYPDQCTYTDLGKTCGADLVRLRSTRGGAQRVPRRRLHYRHIKDWLAELVCRPGMRRSWIEAHRRVSERCTIFGTAALPRSSVKLAESVPWIPRWDIAGTRSGLVQSLWQPPSEEKEICGRDVPLYPKSSHRDLTSAREHMCCWTDSWTVRAKSS